MSFRTDLEEMCRGADRLAAVVHEGGGLQQDQAFSPAIADVRRRALGKAHCGTATPDRDPCDRIDRHEADVVPVARHIGRARIAEADEEQHGSLRPIALDGSSARLAPSAHPRICGDPAQKGGRRPSTQSRTRLQTSWMDDGPSAVHVAAAGLRGNERWDMKTPAEAGVSRSLRRRLLLRGGLGGGRLGRSLGGSTLAALDGGRSLGAAASAAAASAALASARPEGATMVATVKSRSR